MKGKNEPMHFVWQLYYIKHFRCPLIVVVMNHSNSFRNRPCRAIQLVDFVFYHFRLGDVTLGNTFFQMLSYASAYVHITYQKLEENSLQNIM